LYIRTLHKLIMVGVAVQILRATRSSRSQRLKDAALGNRTWRHCPMSEFQLSPQRFQVGQLTLHVRQTLSRDSGYGFTRLLFLIGKVEQRWDLLDGKPRPRARRVNVL
jgi:hypothetical protein